MQIGGEKLRLVETSLGNRFPRFAVQELGIDFLFPENFERLPLGVIVHTGQSDKTGISRTGSSHGPFHEVEPLTHAHDLSGTRNRLGHLGFRIASMPFITKRSSITRLAFRTSLIPAFEELREIVRRVSAFFCLAVSGSTYRPRDVIGGELGRREKRTYEPGSATALRVWSRCFCLRVRRRTPTPKRGLHTLRGQ